MQPGVDDDAHRPLQGILQLPEPEPGLGQESDFPVQLLSVQDPDLPEQCGLIAAKQVSVEAVGNRALQVMPGKGFMRRDGIKVHAVVVSQLRFLAISRPVGSDGRYGPDRSVSLLERGRVADVAESRFGSLEGGTPLDITAFSGRNGNEVVI